MQTILQRISTGDPSAVAACLDEYGDLVWRLAMRYLSRTADAEDATQEIFIALWASAHRYDPAKGSEAAFVATIAHRRLIDMKRSAWVRRTVPIDRTPDAAAPAPARVEPKGWGSPAEDAARAFERLPHDERDTLWLAIRGGLSHAQIADVTRQPVGTVKTRLRRGVQRLREMSGVASATHARTGEGES